MNLINLFLQKRRMHENQHGFFMVATAYVLSALMLILGSDMFYNINSLAAGNNMDTYEETQDIQKEEVLNPITAYLLAGQIQKKIITPYGLTEATGTGLGNVLAQNEADQGASLWLLGSAISSEEFESLIENMASGSRQDAAESGGTLVSASVTTSSVAAETLEHTSDSTVKTSEVKTAEVKTADVSADTKSNTKSKEKEAAKEEISSLSAKETVNSAVVSITEEEVTMLERIVEAEATGEDMTGKILIANVIFNRMADDEFPDTVEEVIFQNSNGDYQFSPVSDERYWSVKITDETEEAVQRALQGEDYSEGALYFISRKRTNASSAKWFDRNLEWLFKHGGHEFYKNK